MYYYYHRWYDPSTGRFISQDPLGGDLAKPQSLDGYVYVNNIPTTFKDPTGLAGYAIVHPPCPTIFQDFWGSLRCSIFRPATVAGVTGGGVGGVGPATINPTPAGAIIVGAVWLYWLYANWDDIRRSPERVEPTVIPPSPGGKVPTTVPRPPDPTLRLPVVQLSNGTPTSPIDVGGGLGNTGRDGLGQGTGWTVGFSNGYARNLGKVLRSPTAFKVCVGLTGAIALGLWTYETEETARQTLTAILQNTETYGGVRSSFATVQRRQYTAWRGPSEEMSNSLLIALAIIVVFSISVGIGYGIARKSRRAGMTVASAGSLLAVVLIVNYFEEVPVVIVAASFAAVAASMLFALFEVARKDVIPNPT